MEDTNKQVLEKLNNLENYIIAFVTVREQELLKQMEGLRGTITFLEENSKRIKEQNDTLFNEVITLSKKVALLEQAKLTGKQ